jgi:hypothetical protein
MNYKEVLIVTRSGRLQGGFGRNCDRVLGANMENSIQSRIGKSYRDRVAAVERESAFARHSVPELFEAKRADSVFPVAEHRHQLAKCEDVAIGARRSRSTEQAADDRLELFLIGKTVDQQVGQQLGRVHGNIAVRLAKMIEVDSRNDELLVDSFEMELRRDNHSGLASLESMSQEKRDILRQSRIVRIKLYEVLWRLRPAESQQVRAIQDRPGIAPRKR